MVGMKDHVFADRLNEVFFFSEKTEVSVAEDVGVTRQSIATYCTGGAAPRVDVAAKIAKSLNCSLDYLTGLVDDEPEWLNAARLAKRDNCMERAFRALKTIKGTVDINDFLLWLNEHASEAAE